MKLENLRLRKSSLSDLPEILKIEKASFPKGIAYSQNRFERFYRKHSSEFIVAENRKRKSQNQTERKIIGYIIGKKNKKSGNLISLAVAPQWRNKGVGNKLVKFLLNYFKKSGANSVFLNVRKSNKKAISFYEELGFKILKEVKKYYRNGEDAFLLTKRFND